MTNQTAASTIRTTDDQALLAAWRRFLDYDKASGSQKVHHTRIRTAIIVLALASSTLAVVSTYRDSNAIIASVGELLHIVLVVLPAISVGLMTYAASFAPSLSWLAYRTGAELVRREIYLYRMQAGDYAGKSGTEQQSFLLDRIEDANRRVNKIGAPDPYLQTTIANIAALVASKTDNKGDNGFSALSTGEYIAYRITPQKDWYIRKARADYEQMRKWRSYVIVVTGMSAIVAAIRAEALVAVTTSVATALVTYMDLKMFGRNFPIYHPIANSLEIELDKWNILSPTDQQDSNNISGFVKRTEDLFQNERDQWAQQAIQAQQAIEQSLAKVAGQSSNEFAATQSSQTTTNLMVNTGTPDTTLISMETHTVTSNDDGTTVNPPNTGITVVTPGDAATGAGSLTITATSTMPVVPPDAVPAVVPDAVPEVAVDSVPANASNGSNGSSGSNGAALSPDDESHAAG